jgi:hypothetical protein
MSDEGGKRAQLVLRAAIEAGTVNAHDLTIVVVVDKNSDVDVATCAPSHAAADLIQDALLLALHKLNGKRADLVSKISTGKA